MFRTASRSFRVSAPPRTRLLPSSPSFRRFLSTAPPHRSRSWKNSALRWGLAIGAVYYYNNSNLFAEEPAAIMGQIPQTETGSEQLPTLEQLAAERQQRRRQQAQTAGTMPTSESSAAPGAQVGELEEEAGQNGAFNPETGEIDWDCPCLGGMAHGPCGEEFKAAFSCFVYSNADPKGYDCIDKFKGMQDCFRKYPEVYPEELDDDEEDEVAIDAGTAAQPEGALAKTADGDSGAPSLSSVSGHERAGKVGHDGDPEHDRQAKREQAKSETGDTKREREARSEGEKAVPRV